MALLGIYIASAMRYSSHVLTANKILPYSLHRMEAMHCVNHSKAATIIHYASLGSCELLNGIGLLGRQQLLERQLWAETVPNGVHRILVLIG